MRTPDPTDELLRDWASRQEQDAKELRALTKRISEEARVSCFVSLPEVPAARRPLRQSPRSPCGPATFPFLSGVALPTA